MDKAMSKLKLGLKKDPTDLLDKLAAIKCRYNFDMHESKKKAQVNRQCAQYSSAISTTQMIWREKGKELLCKQFVQGNMCNQWCIKGNKVDEKDSLSNEEDKVAITAQTQKGKGGDKKSQFNPGNDKSCNHYKKKGHF